MSIYEKIKDAIIHGVYKPGERLTEENLANELQISRTPIREAIKRLENEGLITPLKRGIMVKKFTKEDIRQIYDLRALLEGYAASQAAIHRTDEDIAHLREASIPFSKIIDHYRTPDPEINKEILETNNLFHDAVIQASKNQYISHLISKVIVVPLVFRSFYWYNLDQLKVSVKTHETILNAIIDRDAERARSAMLEHIYIGRDVVLKSIETSEFEEMMEESEE